MQKIVLGIFIIAFVVVAFFISRDASPILAQVKAGNKTVAVQQGSYCWQSMLRAECVDMMTPYERPDGAPTTVERGEKITITFAKEPAEHGINVWSGADDVETISEDMTFTAPSEPGIYIYEVFARWPENGSTSSVFQLQVR